MRCFRMIYVLVASCWAFPLNRAQAQGPLPSLIVMPPPGSNSLPRSDTHQRATEGARLRIEQPSIATYGTLVCARIPSARDVDNGSFNFVNTIVSANQAAKLSLPVGITSSLEANSKLLVVDYTRSASCVTQDPSVSLIYGQSIRAIIRLQEYDGNLGLSLAAIAANGTLKGKSQSISVFSIGVNNPKLFTYLASINTKDFNVENYGSFIEFLNNVTKLPADSQTTTTVQYLGRIDNNSYTQSIATSFALDRITRGEDCSTAKSNLPQQLSSKTDAVEDTYLAIVGKCDSTEPTELQVLQAKQYLGELRVVTGRWDAIGRSIRR